MRVKMGGHEFEVRQPANMKDFGSCEITRCRNGSVRRIIRLRAKQGERAMLDTALHEGLHACHEEWPEELVRSTATDLARLLWTLGYRRVADPCSSSRTGGS
jgi:hypothetical protein